MKFLVDAQLPRRLVYRLRDKGHDAVHTLDLEDGNRTPDQILLAIADRDTRILITKDADFVNSHLLQGQPRLLLLVSTGNTSNADLDRLFSANLPEVLRSFEVALFVELTATSIVVHGR